MTRARSLFLALVLALVAALVAPAGAAEDPRAQRDAARTKKAELAKQLDALKASEQELLNAAAALDDQVLAQAARVDAARQAVAAAEAELAEAQRQLTETRTRITGLTDALVNRAVEAFIHPEDDTLDDMVNSEDMAEAARKRALLGQVAGNDQDLIDHLDAAREDFELAEAAAQAAAEKAAARRADTENRLAELEQAQAEKARLAKAVSTRQAEVLAEIGAQARAESELTRIIEERAAAERARQRASRGAGANVSPDGRTGAGGCIWPTRGRVTSEYGSRWGRLHAGIDIGAPVGTPIWAAKAGTVIFAGQQSGYGNVVIVDHGGNFTTVYAHQSRLGSSNGQRVSQGQTIGYVGNTGRSTGPHLHFETRYGGSPRNPRSCLP